MPVLWMRPGARSRLAAVGGIAARRAERGRIEDQRGREAVAPENLQLGGGDCS